MPLHPHRSHQIPIYRTTTLMLQRCRSLVIAVQWLIQILLCCRRHQALMILWDLEGCPLARKLESTTIILIKTHCTLSVLASNSSVMREWGYRSRYNILWYYVLVRLVHPSTTATSHLTVILRDHQLILPGLVSRRPSYHGRLWSETDRSSLKLS